MNRSISGLCVLFLLMAGCAHGPVNSTTMSSQAPAGKASVIVQGNSLSITHVDGVKTTNLVGFFVHGFAKRVDLTPGQHTVTVWYGNANSACRSGYVYTVKEEAGDLFTIMDEPVADPKCDLARTWIEGTHQGTMQISSSQFEPLSEKPQTMEQSPLFKWTPPQGKGWIVESRNSHAVVLARDGAHQDETYVVDIQTFGLPNLESAQQFTDYVKEGRQKDAKDPRFTTLDETITPYSSKADYCVSFHHLAIDHNPGARGLFKHDPMDMESYGYVCRLPTDKTVGIHFEYSHRTGKGQEDSKLLQKATDSFASLEF